MASQPASFESSRPLTDSELEAIFYQRAGKDLLPEQSLADFLENNRDVIPIEASGTEIADATDVPSALHAIDTARAEVRKALDADRRPTVQDHLDALLDGAA